MFFGHPLLCHIDFQIEQRLGFALNLRPDLLLQIDFLNLAVDFAGLSLNLRSR